MNRKELLQEQKEELIKVLKARFDKNMKRHEDIEWDKVLESLKPIPINCGLLTKWKEPGANPMLLVMMINCNNTSFVTVRLRVPKDEEAFAMTRKPWSQEKNINLREVPQDWQKPWASSF